MIRRPNGSRSPLARYGFAVAVSAAAVAMTDLWWPWLQGIPFLPGFLAVFLAGAYGGGGPGMTAVALIAVGLGLLVPPTPAFRVDQPGEVLRFSLFVAVGSIASALNGRLHAARSERVFLYREGERARVAAERAGTELRQILDSIQDAFCALDREFRFTYLNRRAEEIMGRDLSELVGRSAIEVYSLGPSEQELMRRASEGSPSHFERFIPIFGGWLEINLYPGLEGGVTIFFRDVTARYEADERLRRYAAIFESSEDAIIAKSLEGKITAWNIGAERLLGYKAEEIIGQPVSVMMPEEHRDDMNQILSRIRRGERVEHFETVRLSKDGRRIHVSLSVSPVKDAEGKIIGAAKIARDISDRRRLEAEKDRLYGEAQDAIRLRDEFLSVAGHELRTPVAALQLQLHTIKRRAVLSQWERIPEAVEKLGRQLDRLAQLTEEVLDVTRIAAGRLRLEVEEIDLAELVREVVDRHGEDARRTGSGIDVDAPDPVRGRWDRSRLDQVVTNLLSNAVKFGSGRPIRIVLRPEGDGAVLQVRDGGIGIAPEDQQKIFTRFERAVSRRSYGGMGLGLWISREIVDAHGGRIEVDSVPGSGSTFRVVLPGDAAGEAGEAGA